MIDLVSVPVLVSRPDGSIVQANVAARAVFAVVEGEPVWEIAETAVARQAFQQAYASFCQQQTPTEIGGDAYRFQFGWQAKTEGGETAVVTTCLPQPHPAPNLNQHLFETVPGIILMLDTVGNIININREGAQALGYHRHDLIGKNWFATCLPPDVQASANVIYHSAINGGDYPAYFENAVRTKDGSEKFWGWHNTVIYQPDDKTVLGVLCTAEDKTLRRIAQEELRQSEMRYRRLVDNLLDIVYVFSNKRGAIFWSKQIETILGYSPDHMKANPFFWQNAIHPDDIDRVNAVIATSEATRGYDMEYRIQDASGQWRWLRDRFLDKYNLGNETIVEGMATDITNQKEMAAQLIASEANLQAVLDATDVAFTFIDTSYQIILTNRLARAFGKVTFNREPQPGDDIRVFVRDDDETGFAANFHRALQGETVQKLLQFSSGNNQRVWLEFTYFPVTSAEQTVRGVCLTTRNVTEQQEMSAALRASEARFRQVAENVEDVVWLVDVENMSLLYANPAVARVWQRPYFDILTDPQQLIAACHPDDSAILKNAFTQLAAPEPNKSYVFDNRIVRPSGEIRWIHSRFFPIPDPDGQIYRLAGITTDITERQVARQQALDLMLERERVKLLASFVQNASHEFRTPLSVIELSAFMLSHLSDPTQQQQKLSAISQQVMRMTALIDSLLLMAQLDMINEIEATAVNLNNLVSSAVFTFARTIKDKSLQVTQNLAPDLPPVAADQRLLQRALQALLHNAIRYTPSNAAISITTAATETAVTVTIRDSGPGIAPEDMPHIYERFFRADKAHSTSGFGLGLPIARSIIHLHLGDLSIANQPEGGTAVTVTLPQATPKN